MIANFVARVQAEFAAGSLNYCASYMATRPPKRRERLPPVPLQASVGRAVKEIREDALAISQRELARRLGVSQRQIWGIEAGRANLSLRGVAALADVLGVPAWELLKRNNPK
jgi:ribosome-binding protein aMBF1 (putative translation factor)